MSGYSRDVFPLLFAFRMCNALVTHTYFNPDEYWQGPEIAHGMVFGHGYRTWEWQEDAKIRTYIHPLLYVPGYYCLKVAGVDSWPVVALVPKVVHALLASALDFAVFVAAKRQFGLTPARISLGLWLTNWFTLYCGTRSFSNNLESCLTLLGISGLFRVREGVAFPPRPRWWQFGRGIEWCLAALSCYIRPTSLLIWIPVALLTAVREPFRLPSAIALGALTVALCVSFDSWMYGSLTVPAWNFVKFNGIYNVARLYGTHSWHWYVSQGIPMAVGVQLPLLALSIVTSLTFCNLPHCRASLALFGLSCLYVGCMSTIGHKEARFLLPVLPFLAMATGAGVYHAWKRCEHAVVPSAGAKPLHKLVGWLTRNVRGLCALGVLVNVGVAVFLCNFHQRGAVAATETLGNIAQGLISDRARAHFWMPCHSTPYHSIVHSSRLHLDFIQCSVWDRLKADQNFGWMTPSDEFEVDPEGYVAQRYSNPADLPEFIVVSSNQEKALSSLLSKWRYQEIARHFQRISDVLSSPIVTETIAVYSKGSCTQYSVSCPRSSESLVAVRFRLAALEFVIWCIMCIIGYVVVVSVA